MRPRAESGRAGEIACLAALGLSLGSASALAHGGDEAAGLSLGEPWLAAMLTSAALAYGVGWRSLRVRSTRGGARLGREARLFALGWVVLAGATLSPLHAAGARSFMLHMAEHELLMLVAAPFLALSRPLVTMLWALPPGGRAAVGAFVRHGAVSRGWRVLSDPWSATLLQAVALWLWHVPVLFELALEHESWHYAQHVSFLASALLFWWSITGGPTGRRRYAVGAFCLFVTSLVGGALGALMALSASPWYASYARLGLAPFGLTPAEDQQLAGLLMWIPGGLIHAGAALWMLGLYLRRGASAGSDEAPRPAPGEAPRAA
jgi:cytochrome c oxidase assembly factor CtaG